MVDFARLWPPEPTKRYYSTFDNISSIKGSRLFRLLREELVRSSNIPLCSDAFTGFSR